MEGGVEGVGRSGWVRCLESEGQLGTVVSLLTCPQHFPGPLDLQLHCCLLVSPTQLFVFLSDSSTLSSISDSGISLCVSALSVPLFLLVCLSVFSFLSVSVPFSPPLLPHLSVCLLSIVPSLTHVSLYVLPSPLEYHICVLRLLYNVKELKRTPLQFWKFQPEKRGHLGTISFWGADGESVSISFRSWGL